MADRFRDLGIYRPYPWYTHIWPLSRIYFAGWERGESIGVARGRFQMGDLGAQEDGRISINSGKDSK